jgi:uncharacterized protein YpiB (UPF0302 family)
MLNTSRGKETSQGRVLKNYKYKMSIAEFVPVYFSNHFQVFENKHFIKKTDNCTEKKTFLYL